MPIACFNGLQTHILGPDFSLVGLLHIVLSQNLLITQCVAARLAWSSVVPNVWLELFRRNGLQVLDIGVGLLYLVIQHYLTLFSLPRTAPLPIFWLISFKSFLNLFSTNRFVVCTLSRKNKLFTLRSFFWHHSLMMKTFCWLQSNS